MYLDSFTLPSLLMEERCILWQRIIPAGAGRRQDLRFGYRSGPDKKLVGVGEHKALLFILSRAWKAV